jgi:hypothetical protein
MEQERAKSGLAGRPDVVGGDADGSVAGLAALHNTRCVSETLGRQRALLY